MPNMRRHATNSEIITIYEFLKDTLELVTPADKETNTPAIMKYKEGFDDKRIAAMASENNDPPLPEKSVAGVRLKKFGTLVPAPTTDPNLEALTELAASLEKRIILAQNDAIAAKKEARLVTEALNKVVAMLATNKVIDCGALLIRATDGSIPGVARAPHNGG